MSQIPDFQLEPGDIHRITWKSKDGIVLSDEVKVKLDGFVDKHVFDSSVFMAGMNLKAKMRTLREELNNYDLG